MSDDAELGYIHIRYYLGGESGSAGIGLDTGGELDIVTQLGLIEMTRDRLLAETRNYDD